MKREILFRGKRVDNGDWAYGSLISPCVVVFNDDGDDEEIEGAFILEADYPNLHEPICFKEVHAESIGQFTGLTDKNGTKIFEGDIFTSHHYPFQDEGERNYDAIIEWIESGWKYVLTCVNSEKRGISEGINHWLGDDGSQIEVIRNIHDK